MNGSSGKEPQTALAGGSTCDFRRGGGILQSGGGRGMPLGKRFTTEAQSPGEEGDLGSGNGSPVRVLKHRTSDFACILRRRNAFEAAISLFSVPLRLCGE